MDKFWDYYKFVVYQKVFFFFDTETLSSQYAHIFQLLTKIIQISSMLLIFKYYIRLVGDNIDYEIHARIQSKEHGNQSIHWTHQYAIPDSVVDPLLDNSKPQRSPDELQLIELLPTPDVQARLKHSWAVIVSRVVTKHLKEFQPLQNVVINHIPHLFSMEASKKSEIVGCEH